MTSPALGYASWEWTVTPGHDAPVELPMAHGWNSTVMDIVLATADGVEVFSTTGESQR